LLLALRLELRDLRLLDDDALARRGLGERPGELRLRVRAIDVGLIRRLLDLALANRLRLERADCCSISVASRSA